MPDIGCRIIAQLEEALEKALDHLYGITLVKLILGVVIIAAMLTGSPRRWVHFSEEQDLAVIQVDQMPSGAAVELWSGAYAVRLSREQLAELALELASLPKRP